MSRLAKKPVPVPEGVTVEREGGFVRVKGTKGENTVLVPRFVHIEVGEHSVVVKKEGDSLQARANVGTAWSLIKNAIDGVVGGFSKTLEIEGVGFRAAIEGDTLVLSLGYVNPVRVKIPSGLLVTVEKNVIAVSGVSKELVGRFAAEVRKLKKPEPYKGKGIRYQGEVIRRKVGKKAATTAAAT